MKKVSSSQIHRPVRDVECEAKPRGISKYVACRPHTKTRSTEIHEVSSTLSLLTFRDSQDDLPDEMKKRAMDAESQLLSAKQQMQTLQQKLINTLDEKV